MKFYKTSIKLHYFLEFQYCLVYHIQESLYYRCKLLHCITLFISVILSLYYRQLYFVNEIRFSFFNKHILVQSQN